MKIVVIGGGMTGRMIKHLIPQAVVLERKYKGNIILADMGCHYLHEKIPYAGDEITIRTGMGENCEPLTAQFMSAYTSLSGSEPWTEPNPQDFHALKFSKSGYRVDIPEVKINYGQIVYHVDLAHRVIETGEQAIHYDILINTIPLNYFIMLSLPLHIVGMNFSYSAIYFHFTNRKNKDIAVNEMKVIYSIEDGIPKRIIRTRDRTWIETSVIPKDENKNWLRIKPGKIQFNKNAHHILQILQTQSVWCFGRFGRWDYDETISSTYHAIIAWKKFLGS